MRKLVQTSGLDFQVRPLFYNKKIGSNQWAGFPGNALIYNEQSGSNQ
jgi:hypothetical protein